MRKAVKQNMEMNGVQENLSGKGMGPEWEAVGVVEVILILVVLIALVIIFQDQLTDLVNNIFSSITSKAGTIY